MSKEKSRRNAARGAQAAQRRASGAGRAQRGGAERSVGKAGEAQAAQRREQSEQSEQAEQSPLRPGGNTASERGSRSASGPAPREAAQAARSEPQASGASQRPGRAQRGEAERSSKKLEKRVAIVTGGGSGIGRASALALAREGAAVLVADVSRDGAERVAEEVRAGGGRAHAQVADVADEASVAAMVAAALARFGGLDILHNNAAATGWDVLGGDGEITGLELAIWERALAVNLRGPFLGCKHAIPAMLKRGGGAIVNTSSASGLTGDLVRTAYGVSKAGVDGLTRYVATQYGKRGIRCNAVAPGVIETPALRQNVPAEQVALFERHHLTPRLGTPEDIAAAVVFLASDDAAFITGQVISVDGGLLAHHPTVAEVRALGEHA